MSGCIYLLYIGCFILFVYGGYILVFYNLLLFVYMGVCADVIRCWGLLVVDVFLCKRVFEFACWFSLVLCVYVFVFVCFVCMWVLVCVYGGLLRKHVAHRPVHCFPAAVSKIIVVVVLNKLFKWWLVLQPEYCIDTAWCFMYWRLQSLMFN